MTSEAEIASRIASEAGALLREGFGRTQQIEKKGEVDLVTAMDRAAEDLIVSNLQKAFPQDGILAEEGSQQSGTSGRSWVIDPLDGTTNFARGFPWFAVSLALVQEGAPTVGVIYQPLLQELFVATRGGGTWLNGAPCRVTDTDDLSEAFLATGFPYDRRQSPVDNLLQFSHAQKAAFACRRAGSACLDLAYVAAGRLDGYWEMKLKPWDMAAGALLVTEAGGTVTRFGEEDFLLDGPEILATNGRLHGALSHLICQGPRIST